ncbi:cytochrome ubiquinol oxidase subunit I [Streptomyces sp. NPDC052721]|uniref:cytochrome ubiquinol oxidase subunit I n=1 Tax=Streptomyces sp. NPDC052721 TaxID=3154955 RepID=UPI00343963A3
MKLLARRWARAMGVPFAVGAGSGTILCFEMGLLRPGLMGRFGQVIGLPFALEGIAFFIEAIFLGIYLYAWDRLAPRRHLLMGVPIVIAGT